MKLQMRCIILLAVILVTEIQGLKCRNNDERSKDEFTEVAVICMYNMSNWDRPNMNSKDYNNGRFNSNRNYNYYQNPNDNNSNNRNNYNNKDMYNRESNQDSMYNRNNRNNYNKYNHDDNYGVRSWRRQQSSRGYGNNDDNTDEEEEDRDNQRSNQREQSNQRKNNYRNSSNNNNNNNYNNNGRNKNNSKKNEDNENSDSLLELSRNSPLEQVEPCLVHCIFREMHMLDEEAMPDKTLVINVMTKRLHDSQVIDFVEESVEDCFELLDTDDKRNPCEFTKNLALCLEEKGRRRDLNLTVEFGKYFKKS